MMFDLWERRWSEKILDKFDINPRTLPRPVPSGTLVGKVSKEVSEEAGLKEGTLVVSGGHDHLCAALSVGAIEEGRILDSTGTTEVILLGLKRAKEVDEVASKENFILADHVAKDTFCLFQGIYCGGLLLDWFLANVLKDKDYHILDKVKYGQNSPLFIPYLRGSDFGVMSGALIGLKDFHSRDSILCSITETMAFELKKMMDGLEKIVDKDTSGWVVRSVGGGARNKLLLRCKANLLNKKIEVPVNQEATCQGAALLAGIGAGLYKDEFEAVKKTFKIAKVYTPQACEVEKNQIRYKKYCKVLEKYREIEEELI
jgi:xylulokinase